MLVRWVVEDWQNGPPPPPQTQTHQRGLKIARIIFSVSSQLDAPSEIGPSGKTQSPSDLSNFVTLHWDEVCDGGGGSFII